MRNASAFPPAIAAVLALDAATAWAQTRPEPKGPVSVQRIFEGTVGQRQRTVLVRQYRILGGQQDVALDLPDRGLLIAQLRGGRLTSIVGGERRRLAEGEWWTVSPPSALRLETEDDSVVIDVVLLPE